MCIFLGYAAGVGKTYAMLEAAHDLKKSGVDVVAGYIEPHERAETRSKEEGLEKIPPLLVDYKGIKLRELTQMRRACAIRNDMKTLKRF